MPAIESDAEKMVIGLGYWFIEDKVKAVNQMATAIEKAIPDEIKDKDEIKEWQTLLERIVGASKNDWKSFSEFCRGLVEKENYLKKAVEEMEKLVPMEAFMAKVTGASTEAADLINKNKSLLDNAFDRFELIKRNLVNKEKLLNGTIDAKTFENLQKKIEQMKKEADDEKQRLLDELEAARQREKETCTLL